MNKTISKYLSKIGSKGGLKSKRKLPSHLAKNMVKVREARKAFKKYYHQCFWSFDPNYKIGAKDVNWVSEQLMKNGDQALWQIGMKLCR